MADGKKEPPKITLANLRPPYPEGAVYRYFENADAHPFDGGSKEFRMVNAWWLCEIATLAYSDFAEFGRVLGAKAGLNSTADFSQGSTQCFAVNAEGFTVVAFRGTETSPRKRPREDFGEVFADLLTDFDALPVQSDLGGRVHHGFKRAVDSVWGGGLGEFLSGLGPSVTVWLTGHSLGAALATLAAAKCERLDGLYTFGSPRAGDGAFARALDRRLSQSGIEHHRFVNNRDVVTTLPPPGIYEHGGALKHIGADGRIGGGPSLASRVGNFLRGALTLPFDATGRLKPHLVNLIPGALEDHVPTLYATHVWNAHAGGAG